MSAYMLISANAAYVNFQHNQRKQASSGSSKRSMNSSSMSNGINTTKSPSSSSSLHSSTKSVSDYSFISGKTKKKSTQARKKQVFDVNRNRYVPVETFQTPEDRAIIRYERQLNKISEYHYNVLNQKMNSQFIKDSVDPESNFLLSRKNLNMLRYIYFEEFTPNQNAIEAKISEDSEKPKLRYMKRITKLQNKRHKIVKGLPSFDLDNSNNVDESLSEEDEDEEDEEHLEEEADGQQGQGFEQENNRKGSHSDQREYIDNDDFSMQNENSYCSSDNSLTFEDVDNESNDKARRQQASLKTQPQHTAQLSIRSLFRSKQFWNSIYQDFKVESPKYFEYLPSVNQLQDFNIEIFDYFLYNMRTLDVSTASPDLESFKHKLSEHFFSYFRDSNYEWFNVMSNFHQKLYRFPNSYDNFRLARVEQKLVKKLLEIITNNLSLSLLPNVGGNSVKENYSKAIHLWSEFMNFVQHELILKRENYENGNTSEENNVVQVDIDESGGEEAPYSPNCNISAAPTPDDTPRTVVIPDSATLTAAATSKAPRNASRNLSIASSENDSIMSSPRKFQHSINTTLSEHISEAEEIYNHHIKAKGMPAEAPASAPEPAAPIQVPAQFRVEIPKKKGGLFNKFRRK